MLTTLRKQVDTMLPAWISRAYEAATDDETRAYLDDEADKARDAARELRSES